MTSTEASPAAATAARDLLTRHPILDGHNDLPWTLRVADDVDLDTTDLDHPVATIQTDWPRMAAGGVGAQFWSVYVSADLEGETAVTTIGGCGFWKGVMMVPWPISAISVRLVDIFQNLPSSS